MRRQIIGFGQDGHGDWAAQLSCLHRQHVRHRPPFQDRSWVLTEAGRAEHLGSDIECGPCDRAELPEGLRAARTAGPFDDQSLPAGLRQSHRVAEATWGVLHVIEGSIGFNMAADPPIARRLVGGDRQALPPGVPHYLSVEGPVLLAVDFFVGEGGAARSGAGSPA